MIVYSAITLVVGRPDFEVAWPALRDRRQGAALDFGPPVVGETISLQGIGLFLLRRGSFQAEGAGPCIALHLGGVHTQPFAEHVFRVLPETGRRKRVPRRLIVKPYRTSDVLDFTRSGMAQPPNMPRSTS
jgi:hypothetical protein